MSLILQKHKLQTLGHLFLRLSIFTNQKQQYFPSYTRSPPIYAEFTKKLLTTTLFCTFLATFQNIQVFTSHWSCWAIYFKVSFRTNIVSLFYRNRDPGHVISFYQRQKGNSWWKPRGVTRLGWRHHWQAGMGISRSTACSGKIHLRLQANLLNIVPTDI